ncbi:MAG: hypothetical protein RIC55_16645 [Pirellulaceae bacterium]
MSHRIIFWCALLAGLAWPNSLSRVRAQDAAATEEPAATAEAAAEEDATEEQPAPLTDRLLEIARSRVDAHELRLETLHMLAELREGFAQARLDRAKTRLKQRSARLTAAEAELQHSEAELKRLERLVKEGAVEETRVLFARNEHRGATQMLHQTRAAVAEMEAELREAEFQRQEVKLESALQTSQAMLALLDAQEGLARAEEALRLRARFRREFRDREDRPAETPGSSDASTDRPER